MGVLDKRQKRYFEDPKKFADTWNALAFRGLEVISWEELCESNPVLTYADAVQTLEKTSDIVMKRTMDGKLLDLKNLMETMHLSLEQAMNALRIPVEEREKFEKMIRNR